jgi:hypothetical protein
VTSPDPETDAAIVPGLPLPLVEMPAGHAVRLLRSARGGDREAAALLRESWPPGARCLLCDAKPPEGAGTWLAVPNPTDPPTALLCPLCDRCAGLSGELFWSRVRRHIGALFNVRVSATLASSLARATRLVPDDG